MYLFKIFSEKFVRKHFDLSAKKKRQETFWSNWSIWHFMENNNTNSIKNFHPCKWKSEWDLTLEIGRHLIMHLTVSFSLLFFFFFFFQHCYKKYKKHTGMVICNLHNTREKKKKKKFLARTVLLYCRAWLGVFVAHICKRYLMMCSIKSLIECYVDDFFF